MMMCLWKVFRFLLLNSVLQVCFCWTSSCPVICQCTEESIRCTRETQLSSQPESLLSNNLRLIHLPLKEVDSGSFRGLLNVSRIEISQSSSLHRIKRHAFLSLLSLSEVLIQNINNLEIIEKGAFTDLPKLKYLSICNTGMRHFPDLTTISSTGSYFFLELGDNMQMDTIPSNAFLGMTEEYTLMNLFRNGFKDIQRYAFNGTKLDKLLLKGNEYLNRIDDAAFEGAVGPSLLDVSATLLHALPVRGLLSLRVLAARSAPALQTLPPLEGLRSLQEAQLTYPSHCCAFYSWRRQNRDAAFLTHFGNLTIPCSSDSSQAITGLMYSEDTSELNEVDFQYPDLEMCGTGAPLKCTPQPDAFNPCEDLLGHPFLRIATWAVTILAIVGNVAVLGVLLTRHRKLTVSRFLMCNLAFADLCMGVYLLLIAAVDHRSRREYYNHATAWQTGPGCRAAGFLTVFASELSVYTLTVITVERWHTIHYAMQLNRKLRLRHVVAMMIVGWLLSLLAALLPILGVSSYTKVSICLPMDIETAPAQGYVIVVLLANVLAFLVVCTCYGRIYLMVRQPRRAARRTDTKIAKRMAVLVFTDFLCMAPISFFAISAALRAPLITVSHAKVLLVLFYPLNSLCNPFIYTIFTRAFRRDVRFLVSRRGCCHAWLTSFWNQSRGAHKGPRSSPLKKHNSLRFYAYHIKMQGWFHNRSPK